MDEAKNAVDKGVKSRSAFGEGDRKYGAPKGGSHPGSVIRRCRQVPGGSSQRLDNNLTPEREYATDFCAKAAAIRAGYSEPSARQTGYMLLRNPVVREQLVKHMEKASSASVMSQREVLERDSAIASVDPLAVFDLEGGKPRLRPLDQIPEEVRRCISSIKETGDGFRVAFHSLHPALDRLSRYYNTLSELDDRNAVTVDDQEKAKAVADWIERMALEQKVTTRAPRPPANG